MIVETCKGYRDSFANINAWSWKWHAGTLANPTPAGRKALQGQLTATNQEVIVTTKALPNGRLIARLRQSNVGSTYAFGIALRVGGTPSAKEAIVFRLQATSINLMRLSAAGTVSSQVTNANRQNVPGTWYWFDVLVVGNRYLCQVWEDGTARPDGWLVGATFGNLMGSGFGIYTANQNAIIQCDKLITTIL